MEPANIHVGNGHPLQRGRPATQVWRISQPDVEMKERKVEAGPSERAKKRPRRAKLRAGGALRTLSRFCPPCCPCSLRECLSRRVLESLRPGALLALKNR